MRRYSKNSLIKLLVCAAAWTVFLSTSQAQTASCPIQPVLVKNIDSQIAIVFTTTSGQPVVRYQFALTFFDHAGRAHSFPLGLSENVHMSAHARRTSIWQTRLAQNFLYPYVQAFLQQVAFADGTSWVDDGSHACSIVSVQE
ncbi:MAG TPA: hypothetical protein VL156_18445 [Terriglobales bacterium]|jgi:hypothetical protein|nr:hypothetical protein [Terriglobales bacterium]